MPHRRFMVPEFVQRLAPAEELQSRAVNVPQSIQVGGGGELVLSATPHASPGPANAGFYYENSHLPGVLPSGTFAFSNPGSTISLLLAGVAPGDPIALPGSSVSSVTYGP